MAKKPKSNRETYMDLVSEIKRKFRNIGKRGYVPLDNIYKEETPKHVLQKQLTKLKNVVENIYQFAKFYDPLGDKYILGTERRKQERSEAAYKGWKTRRANEAKRRTEELLRQAQEQGEPVEPVTKELSEQLEPEPMADHYEELRKQDRENYEKELERRRQAFQQTMQEMQLKAETEFVLSNIEELVDRWDESLVWSESLKSVKRVDVDTLKKVLEGAITSLGREQVALNCLNNQTELMEIVTRVLYASGDTYKQYGIDSGRSGVQRDIAKFREIIYGRRLTVEESKEISEMMERFNEGV